VNGCIVWVYVQGCMGTWVHCVWVYVYVGVCVIGCMVICVYGRVAVCVWVYGCKVYVCMGVCMGICV